MVSGWASKAVASRARVAAFAWLSGSAWFGLLEWLLVLRFDAGSIRAWDKRLLLLLIEIGNIAPYVLAALVLLLALELARAALVGRLGRTRGDAVLAAGVAALSLAYTVPLGRFAFSGPAARGMPHHDLWVAVAVALASGAIVAFMLLAAGGLLQRRPRAYAGLVGLTTMVCLWLSRRTQPNEYEPLHLFLALWAVLLSAELGLLLHAKRTPTKSATWAALVLTLGAACAAPVIAGRAPGVAWVVWSKTAASRYVTARVRLFEPKLLADGSNAEMVTKPVMETEQSVADRAKRRQAALPNIVLFSVDGLRPDHLGAYGYRTRRTSPNIDRFASRGVRFDNAFSSYPQTARFNTSLLLGRYMGFLGRRHRVPAAFQKLAITKQLHDSNYHILVKAWFEHSSQNDFNPRDYDIDTHIPKSRSKNHLEEPLEERLPIIEAHLRAARQAGKPTFMWMHLLGTHPVRGKFVPDPAFRFGSSRAHQYDSAIAGSDRWLEHVERLMRDVADPGRPTVWVILSDHGVKVDEEGRDLYAGIVRVPLIIVADWLKPGVRDEPVDTSLDLAATVLDITGVTPPASYDGISLLPLLLEGDPEGRMQKRLIPLMRSRWRGAVYGHYKLLEYNGSMSLVNTAEDPEEDLNLVDRFQGLAKRMQAHANTELARRKQAFQTGMHGGEEAREADDDE